MTYQLLCRKRLLFLYKDFLIYLDLLGTQVDGNSVDNIIHAVPVFSNVYMNFNENYAKKMYCIYARDEVFGINSYIMNETKNPNGMDRKLQITFTKDRDSL